MLYFWLMFSRIVLLQHKYGFVPVGIGLTYAPGKFGIVVNVACNAFAEAVFRTAVCAANVLKSTFAAFLKETAHARTTEPSVSLQNQHTAVRVDGVTFFRINTGRYMWRLDVNPHPARILLKNQLTKVLRTLGVPANY